MDSFSVKFECCKNLKKCINFEQYKEFRELKYCPYCDKKFDTKASEIIKIGLFGETKGLNLEK